MNMKSFHTTNYKLYSEKVEKDFRASVISDLHFSYMISDQKLSKILYKLYSINPDYILFPGDIIDSTDMIKSISEEKRLLNWLKELGNIAPFIISLGSHDYYKKVVDSDGKSHWQYNYPKDFIEIANEIDNVYVLDNEGFEDKNLYVTGYTQSMDYYHPKSENMNSFLHPVNEDKDLMIKELQELNKTIKPSADKVDIALIHSPVHLTDKDVTKELEDYDYFISGHMHNGCVPPVLYEIWNSSRGLIAPNKKLFPKNERNTLRKREDKLVVNGPITTFQECTGSLQKFNVLFPSYMSVLDFTNDKDFDRKKVYTKKSYRK